MNSFHNRVSYLVNIPVSFSDCQKEVTVDRIINNIRTFQSRKFQAVIGVNSGQSIDQGEINEITSLFQRKLKDLSFKSLVTLYFYQWEKIENFNVNYASIRNKLFNCPLNEKAYESLKQQRTEKLFYVTIDSDTTFDQAVLEQFEKGETERVSPFVVAGFFDFDYSGVNTKLFDQYGRTDWEGFLACKSSLYSKAVKKDLSGRSLDIKKHPLFPHPTEPHHFALNVEGLTYLQKKPMSQNLKLFLGSVILANKNYFLFRFFDRKNDFPCFKKCKKPDGPLKLHQEELSKRMGELRVKVLNAKDKKEPLSEDDFQLKKVLATKIIDPKFLLYPAEPILFISFFQKRPNFEIALYEFIKNRKITQIWGSKTDNEGLALCANIRQVWRMMKKSFPALKEAFSQDSSCLVDYTFDYTTALPARCLEIHPINSSKLPYSVDQLRSFLTSEKRSLELKTHIDEVLSYKKLSLLSNTFLAQVRLRLDNNASIDDKKPVFAQRLHGEIDQRVNDLWVKTLTEKRAQCVDMIFAQIQREIQEVNLASDLM